MAIFDLQIYFGNYFRKDYRKDLQKDFNNRVLEDCQSCSVINLRIVSVRKSKANLYNIICQILFEKRCLLFYSKAPVAAINHVYSLQSSTANTGSVLDM